MNNARKEHTFFWFIENYSYCWHKNGEALVSPDFTADVRMDAIWSLKLYPRGHTSEYKRCISLFLAEGNKAVSPEDVTIKYELSILAEDGACLPSVEDKGLLQKNKGWISVQMDEVLLRRKPEYLPNDTLTVRCKMWIDEGSHQRIGRSCGRTRIGIERISFVHTVENYRALYPNQKMVCRIRAPSLKGRFITCSMYKSDGSCCEEKLMVEIIPPSGLILVKWELALLDASGSIIEWDVASNRFEAAVNDISKLSLRPSTKEDTIADEGQYLTDNKLSFLCDCTFSTGVEFQKIEETMYEMDGKTMEHISTDDTESLSECPNALDDLKAIYTDQFLTDVELRTKTKSFPAHKVILCSRSPVFKAMMGNDMREKSCNFIDIEDLDDDTVHQLLLFLYSDNLEDLQWETATKLYYVADKYEIEKLKAICLEYLEDNLSTDTAIELLLLADTHNDSRLKEVVEDFILENNKQVFSLVEWEQLMEANPQLAVKTMHLMYKRKSRCLGVAGAHAHSGDCKAAVV